MADRLDLSGGHGGGNKVILYSYIILDFPARSVTSNVASDIIRELTDDSTPLQLLLCISTALLGIFHILICSRKLFSSLRVAF